MATLRLYTERRRHGCRNWRCKGVALTRTVRRGKFQIMSVRQSSLMRIPATPAASFAPERSGLLQRKCACGKAAGPTGECEDCKKKRESGAMLQRKSTESSSEAPRFSYDFSRVPVHSGSQSPHSSPSGLNVDGSLSVHPPAEENSVFLNDEPKPAKPEPKPSQARAQTRAETRAGQTGGSMSAED